MQRRKAHHISVLYRWETLSLKFGVYLSGSLSTADSVTWWDKILLVKKKNVSVEMTRTAASAFLGDAELSEKSRTSC